MKKGLFSLVVSCALLLTALPIGANAASSEKEIIKNTSLVSDEFILKEAYNGNVINDRFTETKVFQNDDVTVVELNKTLSETYENGELVDKDGLVLMDITLNTEDIETQEQLDNAVQDALLTEGTISSRYVEQLTPAVFNTSGDVSTLSTGNGDVSAEKKDGSLSVNFRYALYFDVYTLDNVEYFKVKYVNYLATLLDSTFSLYEINSKIGWFGFGYKYNNGSYSVGWEQSPPISYVVSNPVSQKVYTKHTNSLFFVQNPSQSSGQTKASAQATLKFKRNSTGTIYSLVMPEINAQR